MSVTLEDRPIETVREQVIDQLIMNYSHGEISLTAFESRLDKAMNSNNNNELDDLIADLSLTVDTQYQDKKDHVLGRQYHQGQAKAFEKRHNVLSSNVLKGTWDVPKEINIYTILGNDEIDFSQARFKQANVKINIYCLLGNVSLLIPEDINVVNNTQCIVSSMEQESAGLTNKASPTLTLEGKVILGNIDVTIKQTIKEKFVRFADGLKSLFR